MALASASPLISRQNPGAWPTKIVSWLSILARGAKATGAARKKAIVAVARQLAVDQWRLNTGRATAEDLGLACPETFEKPTGQTEA